MYDTLNRLRWMQCGIEYVVYQYDGVNPLVQRLTRPNGSVTTYHYNALNQLTEILNATSTGDVLSQHTYTYNRLDLRDNEWLTGSAIPPLPELPDETKEYASNTVNQLLSITNPAQTFVYDDDGNMTQGYTKDGYVFTAVYDAENRMTSLEYTDSSSVLHRQEFRYSGDDLVAEQKFYENGGLVATVRFVRDGMLAIQERNGSNVVEREYTWGLNLGGGIGGLLNLHQGGQDYAYLYDGNGNIEAVLDNTQAVVAGYRYDPFGVLLNQTGSFEQPYGFSTKRYDEQIGLIKYEYRNYVPEVGRWLTRDPLGEAGGLNLYAFVGNNPVNWVDPWGLAVTNNSSYIVYYKPEEDTTTPPIMPHDTHSGTQDGIAIPCLYPGQVFKTVTGVDVIIHKDGSIELIAKSKKQAIGQSLIGGWKGLEWNLYLIEVEADEGWNALFEKSLQASKEICEESKEDCK